MLLGILLALAGVYLLGVGWFFVKSGGAYKGWGWPLRAAAVLWYLIGPSRNK